MCKVLTDEIFYWKSQTYFDKFFNRKKQIFCSAFFFKRFQKMKWKIREMRTNAFISYLPKAWMLHFCKSLF